MTLPVNSLWPLGGKILCRYNVVASRICALKKTTPASSCQNEAVVGDLHEQGIAERVARNF